LSEGGLTESSSFSDFFEGLIFGGDITIFIGDIVNLTLRLLIFFLDFDLFPGAMEEILFVFGGEFLDATFICFVKVFFVAGVATRLTIFLGARADDFLAEAFFAVVATSLFPAVIFGWLFRLNLTILFFFDPVGTTSGIVFLDGDLEGKLAWVLIELRLRFAGEGGTTEVGIVFCLFKEGFVSDFWLCK
jgi:hypothetical protein